jgi:peptidoglycan/xylan/chitin deacetylase (PgdA/CDA1 family)
MAGSGARTPTTTTPEAEARDLDRAAAAIEAATGARPARLLLPGRGEPVDARLLAERGYLYTSNGFDDDLPYRDPSGLLVVPYALDSNDMKFFHPNGFVRAAEMVEYVADALDVLEAEAARGLPRLLNIGFHLRIVGRPGRFKAFEGVLAELHRRRHRLWIARRVDIAEAFLGATA